MEVFILYDSRNIDILENIMIFKYFSDVMDMKKSFKDDEEFWIIDYKNVIE
jgi:hypothetical protein